MTERRAYFRRARHTIANRGFLYFVKLVTQRLWYLIRRKPIPGHVRPDTGPHPFDQIYGVDTTGLIFGEALFDHSGRTEQSQDAQYWVTGYYGVAPSAFNRVLERMNLDWPRYTFVDVGCGMGRALLLATRFPFRDIVGVELAASLAEIARKNVECFHAAWKQADARPRVITGDATQFELPAGPLLLFLYHPFAGPVMKRFLAHVTSAVEAEPREVVLLYGNPELTPEIIATPGFREVWRDVFMFSREDADADRFGSTYEQFAIFEATRR